MSSIERLIDANFNRSREALRTLEDVARFQLNDPDCSAALKSARHRLTQAVGMMASAIALAAARDTPGDVGTQTTTAQERSRATMQTIVCAASARASESLRVLEESAKLRAPESGAAQEIERVRYDVYEIGKRLTLATAPSARPFTGWRLCVILSESLCPNGDWMSVARRCARAGADCIQLREKDLPDMELLARARGLVEIGREEGCAIVINDRVDVALSAGADGVHVGPDDLSVEEIRRIAGMELLVGVSTKTIEMARAARLDGADYCGVGAMFPTKTKAGTKVSGPAYLRAYLNEDPPLPPALAIGGITSETIGELGEGVARPFGIAVSAAICSASAPDEVCRSLLSALETRLPKCAIETKSADTLAKSKTPLTEHS